MKIQKYYAIFVYILQGKMEKKGKKIRQLNGPKYQKPKDENMRLTKHMKPSFFFEIFGFSSRWKFYIEIKNAAITVYYNRKIDFAGL